MKKIALCILTLLFITALLTACPATDDDIGRLPDSGYNGGTDDDNGYGYDNGDDDWDFEWDPSELFGNPDPELVALIGQLYEGIEVPMSENFELTAENFTSFLFIDPIEGARGVKSQAAISVIPHAVVLVELPEGVNAAIVAAQIEQAADPAKWICVHAEKLGVFYSGRFVVMAMSFEAVVDGIEANYRTVLG